MTPRLRHGLQALCLPLSLSALILGLALGGDEGRAWLGFDRERILDGQWWRLLGTHLVHLGPSHVLMNLAGLWLTWILVGSALPLRAWLVLLPADALITGLSLLVFNPWLPWYLGFSGVLHGLLAAGAVAEVRAGRPGGWLLLGILGLKLGWEQWAGPLPGSEDVAGGRVIVDAHLYGALGGLLALRLPLPTDGQGQSSPASKVR